MPAITNHHRFFGAVFVVTVCTFLAATVTSASVIVTQVQDRCHFSLWLLSQHIQQDIAHNLIIDSHDIIVVPGFSFNSMAGADVVYVSPAYDELSITLPEMQALRQFVIQGGRLIIPGDYGPMWIAELGPIAEHLEVFYGDSVINTQINATIISHDNPVTNGPHGMIFTIRGNAVNNDLNSKLDAFQIIATWAGGSNAIGYMQLGAGEIVFLTDFNSFDSDTIHLFDNQNFWLNLFEYTACPADLDSNGTVGTSDLLELFSVWGTNPVGPPDFDGNGTIDTNDLLELFANWGPCSTNN